MKKLDKLILKAFLGPFVLTFCVVVFILLIIFLVKYVEDMIGKGLGAEVYSQLLFYFSLLMVPSALPLSVLLSSLITFGNLGEHNELTAIKGAGVSLIRALTPVFLIVLVITVGAFYFNNNILPKVSLKAYSLLYDVRTKKASVNFKEGVFYEGIPGHRIKISQKFPDGKSVKGVMIYNHTAGKGNTDLIMADSGRITTINDDQFLVFELYNGKSFSEYAEDAPARSERFIRNAFDKSRMIFSLASFALNRTKEELFSSNKYMKNAHELNYITDSIKNDSKIVQANLPVNIKPYYSYFNQNFPPAPNYKFSGLSLLNKHFSVAEKELILSRAVNQARSIKAYTSSTLERIKYLEEDANSFSIEKYKKYTQAFACLVMFLIGAPLGAIIKKGGLGMPVLISIIFFIILYVFSILGEKWAKESVVPVAYGIWAANAILLPVGLLLLKQAKNDSKLLDMDFYSVLYRKFKKNKPVTL
jgi:lipopolysaccharide export system permease protein